MKKFWKKTKNFVSAAISLLPSAVLEQSVLLSNSALNSLLRKKRLCITQKAGYYSQYGQDQYIWEVLFGRQMGNGVFIDVGAYDGVVNSNTYFFERHCGFTGVLVEANPDVVSRLEKNRGQVIIHCGIANEHFVGSHEFLCCSGYGEQLSCFRLLASREHLSRIESEKSEHGFSVRSVLVPLMSMDDIVQQRHLKAVDILSVDVEGAEVSVLLSFPFETCPVNVVIVEANKPGRAINLLKRRGFSLRAVIGTDLIFQNNHFISTASRVGA